MKAAATAFLMLSACLTATPAHAHVPCPIPLADDVNGPAAIRALGDDLPRAAKNAGMSSQQFTQTLREDRSLWVDSCGRAYYVEPPVAATEEPRARALNPAGDAFALHSRPGSKRTIFLDFDGYDTTGGPWEGDGIFTAGPFSEDDDDAFSDTELASIGDIWLRVAEDYAPFDVDVTTQTPDPTVINRASAGDDVFGISVAIVGENPLATTCGCGGLGYLDVFDEPSSYSVIHPLALVFVQGTTTRTKYVSEAATHEAGHNLGLSHDGNPGDEYYEGQGLWAPIMGVGYYKPLSQWSMGEYADPTNTEDDLAVITGNGAPYAADDVGDQSSPAQLSPGTTEAEIARNTDEDWFTFTASGTTTLTVTPQAVSPNLDAELTLYDASKAVLASADPAAAMDDDDVATGLGATITRSLTSGTYYVRVRGVGSGSALETGYSDYGSMGRYDLRLSTDGPLAIPARALPEGVVGTPFTATLGATAGTTPYTFALISGTLPGLTLAPNGTLSGTPTSSGTYPFTVRVTDAKASTASREFSLTVIDTVTLSGADLPTGTVGSPYSATLTAVDGRAPYAFAVTAGALPAGLGLSSDGAVTGTPTAAGTSEATVTVTDGRSTSASAVFRISVQPVRDTTPIAPPVITPAPARITTPARLPGARRGKNYSVQLQALNASAWRLTAGALPKGLRLDASGRLTGKAKRTGSFTFTVEASGTGGAARATLRLRVRPRR